MSKIGNRLATVGDFLTISGLFVIELIISPIDFSSWKVDFAKKLSNFIIKFVVFGARSVDFSV
uniref:Uncharacterized protein n=1 Tax=Candidatus Kentrum eta TaxID=2126337 RepID=A0A450UID8_9GAMM|nr:MAG: hypothetical protein BECKH772A_GA0070896_1004115 [Candidatus Kentron sp. H]VFJ93211.1 MAG: hypothetical protein BECKH772B_GA0070898_1004015 [Candidatus Kentron sp. H]VFK00080.1 MAG: hypothetical protein BECKH772C_GA0070978_1003915 [Candidatus Kentron sp. H]